MPPPTRHQHSHLSHHPSSPSEHPHHCTSLERPKKAGLSCTSASRPPPRPIRGHTCTAHTAAASPSPSSACEPPSLNDAISPLPSLVVLSLPGPGCLPPRALRPCCTSAPAAALRTAKVAFPVDPHSLALRVASQDSTCSDPPRSACKHGACFQCPHGHAGDATTDQFAARVQCNHVSQSVSTRMTATAAHTDLFTPLATSLKPSPWSSTVLPPASTVLATASSHTERAC